jgi:ferric-dicitrate binding protein FerR (iron transport regulator)
MSNDDSPIARLIRLAGTRDMPSGEATQRAREAAEAAWQRGLRQAAEPARRARRIWLPLALAASCALLALFILKSPAPRETRVVASVVAVDAGPVMRGTDEALAVGMPVPEGRTVATDSGRAAFLLGDSLSLRADRHTLLEFESVDRVRLLKGSIYVDSGGLNAASPLRIGTPAGEVRHLGTQFLVSVDGAATRIRVREGRVALERPGAPVHDMAAGDALEIDGARLRFLQGLESHGADWEWASSTAPAFDIENRPLSEFLAWVSREHGWQLAYHDEKLRLHAQDIRLHGSVSGLSVAAMLERIALITGVSLRVHEGVLQVGEA